MQRFLKRVVLHRGHQNQGPTDRGPRVHNSGIAYSGRGRKTPADSSKLACSSSNASRFPARLHPFVAAPVPSPNLRRGLVVAWKCPSRSMLLEPRLGRNLRASSREITLANEHSAKLLSGALGWKGVLSSQNLCVGRRALYTQCSSSVDRIRCRSCMYLAIMSFLCIFSVLKELDPTRTRT